MLLYFGLFLLNSGVYNHFRQVNRSNIHAIYTFIFSLLHLNGINFIVNNYLSLMVYSILYSIYDINYLLERKIKGYQSLIVHHSLIIYAILFGKLFYNSSDKIVNILALNYLTEISTPFFNKSFDLLEQKKENTYEYKLVNTLVVIVFGISRILMIPYLFYYSYEFGNNVFICQSILSTMNVIWYYKICKYYRKIMSKKIENKED
jgi:hypothetical protein